MSDTAPNGFNFQYHISHPVQGFIAHAVYFVMGLIPLDWASAMGGWIGRKLGPRFRVTKLARQNLKNAFPEKSDAEIETILDGMWDNLGRVAFEFPHIGKIDIYGDKDRFKVNNQHIIEQLREDGQCGLFYSGHFANWEVSPATAAQQGPGMPIHLIYRAPDNRFMRKLFAKRKPHKDSLLLPKGANGAREALGVLKKGEHLAMLVDQKMNNGIAVPLFGQTAMTAPALAQFALKFKCPVVPVQIKRTKGARFEVTYHPPMEIELSGDKAEDTYRIMEKVNQSFEDWIRECPEQWLWVHRRWPKD